jgi:hypothetical protein
VAGCTGWLAGVEQEVGTKSSRLVATAPACRGLSTTKEFSDGDPS